MTAAVEPAERRLMGESRCSRERWDSSSEPKIFA